uniref:Uncharacterized protein n=1 Tax=Romanomermis culicivorax TaxID=13658 RepID=A0A915HNA9_ROMCU
MAIAVKSLIKDITDESFAVKTKIPTQTNIMQIESDEDDVSQTDTITPTTTAKTTSLNPLSKNLWYSQYELDSIRGEDVRQKAPLVKTSSMRDISCTDDDDKDSKVVPPRIIPTRYKILKKHK